MDARRAEQATQVVAAFIAVVFTTIRNHSGIPSETSKDLTSALEDAARNTTTLLAEVLAVPDPQPLRASADYICLAERADEQQNPFRLAQPASDAFHARQWARNAYRQATDLLVVLTETVVADNAGGKAFCCEAIYLCTLDHPAFHKLHYLASTLYDADPPLDWNDFVAAALPLMGELDAYRTSLRAGA